MKRLICILLTVLTAVGLCLTISSTAFAEEALSTSVKVNPPTLPGPGTVSLVIAIKNDGDPVTNVRIQYPEPSDTIVTVGDIGTGETKEHVSESWSITQEMLDKDLTFTVFWVSADGTEKKGMTPAIVIKQAAQTVDVSGNASAEPLQIKKGDNVTFKFSLQNKGTVPIENAFLTAPPLEGGAQIGSQFTLEPGATKNMEYRIAVEESMNVVPVFSYVVNGEQQKLDLNTLNVSVDAASSVSMGVTLQANQTTAPKGSNVDFTVTVTNTGASQLDGLTVKDFNGNPVTMTDSMLQAGASTTGKVTIPIEQTGNYAFTASAIGAGGQTVNMQSNNIAITLDGDTAPTPAESAGGGLDVSKIIRTDISLSSTQLKGPGEVKMGVTVTNLSTDTLTNIVVMDDLIGTIGTVASLEPGATDTFDKSFMAEETAEYEFVTVAELPDGTSVESKVGTTIYVEPKQSGFLGLFGGSGSSGMATWQLWLLIIIIAAAAVVLILLLYLRNQKNNGRRQGANRPRPYYDGRGGEAHVSPGGRERPQRYNTGRHDMGTGRPERASSVQQQRYERNRASRNEVIDPKARAAAEKQAERREAEVRKAQQKSATGGKVKGGKVIGKSKNQTPPPPGFGDRNKF